MDKMENFSYRFFFKLTLILKFTYLEFQGPYLFSTS
jgi:hypothetical protein